MARPGCLAMIFARSAGSATPPGLMAISYEEPSKTSNFNRVIEYPKYGAV